MANKIKYGIRSVYYAVATEGTGGALTYATPVALPGAVNLTLSQEGEQNTFYADDVAYFTSNSNNGYSGTLEVALIPDSFRSVMFRFRVWALPKRFARITKVSLLSRRT